MNLARLGLICYLICSAVLAQETSSKITSVTVYPDRALVNRTASLQVKSGTHGIVFSHLPVTLMDESLRVSGKGSAKVKLLAVETRTSFLKTSPQEEVKILEKEIEKLKDQEEALLEDMKNLDAEREFFSSIKLYSANQLSKEIVTREPKVEEWKKLVQFITDAYTEISNRGQEINKEVRELRALIQARQNTLNKIRGSTQKAEKDAIVNIEVSKDGSFELELAYVVPGASWLPIYDARAMESERLVNLSYHAIVRQITGEDWEDIDLILSTALPSVGAKMPELEPWYLGGAEGRHYDEKKLMLGRAKESSVLQEQAYRLEEPMVIPFAEAIDVGTSVIFKIPVRCNIPSDNSPHRVTISIDSFEARMSYVTTPKLSPYAYLRAELTNTKDYPLLAGVVNIFLGDNYIGTSSIKSISSNEKFELDLGIDEGIKVKRELIKSLSETSFLGKRVRKNYSFKITLENHKKTREVITAIDQVPVSRNEQILVKLLEGTEKPTEQDEKGILKWKIILSPGEKREIKLGWFVEYPNELYIPEL